MSTPEVWLSDAQLPGLFRAADATSTAGQRATLFWSQLRLAGAVVAAVGGAFSWMLDRVDVFGLVGLIGFAAALAAELMLLVQHPEQEWYAGRAIAESTKTLAWKFAVRGAPFGASLPDAAARALFTDRLRVIITSAPGRVTAPIGSDAVVTEAMISLRGLPLTERKAVYLRDRITDQRDWYVRKTALNRRRAVVWRLVLVTGEIGAVVVAACRAFNVWQADWSGILAALVATGAAWLSLKQHSALAAAYAVTATELALAAERLDAAPEEEWPYAVADAEEAISREHTMWLASRSDRSN